MQLDAHLEAIHELKTDGGEGGKGSMGDFLLRFLFCLPDRPVAKPSELKQAQHSRNERKGEQRLFPRVHGCLFLSGEPRNVGKHWCSNCFPSRGIDMEPCSHRLWDRTLGALVGPAVVARVDLACRYVCKNTLFGAAAQAWRVPI